MTTIDIASFDTPVGAGMSGVVFASEKYPNLVLKRMDMRICKEARRELAISQNIYNMYRQYILCNSKGRDPAICIPQQLMYVDGNNYCAIVMEKMKTISGKVWHIALSDAIAMKDREYGVNYSIPVGTGNPSRGFFASEASIAILTNIDSVIYRIGLLDGIMLFGAGVIPVDVEYILSPSQTEYDVCAIDFGLVTRHNYDDDAVEKYIDELDRSIYYVPVDKHRESFIRGLEDAAICFGSESFASSIIDKIREME